MTPCPNCGGDFAGPEHYTDHCASCGWVPGGTDDAATAAWEAQQAAVQAATEQELSSAANQASQEWLATHTAEELAAVQAAEAARITEPPPSPVQMPGG